ncbi:hypothetical protein, partial, partial [Parasitella parasitica]
IQLLKCPQVFKIGKNVGGDLRRLSKDFEIGIAGALELSKFCFDRGVIKSTSLSLQRICEECLGHSLQKEAGLRCEGWEDEVLLQEKIDYAALDAWVALELFDHFKNIPISNVPLDANSISIGQNVAIFSSFKNLPVAYGIVEDESITNNNHLSIDQAHASCDLHANSKHVVLTITK